MISYPSELRERQIPYPSEQLGWERRIPYPSEQHRWERRIPKIMHYIWLDKNTNNNESYPEKYNKYTQSFNTFNPEFTVMFWNGDRINKLFDNHPELTKYKAPWQNLYHHIQKCDMARYAILYIYGGMYVDLDFMFYKNISPLLDRKLFLVKEPSVNANNHRVDGIITNGFIGSVPRHPFWLEFMDFIIDTLKRIKNVKSIGNITNTTGPLNLYTFFVQSKYANTSLVNTCDIIPIYQKNGKTFITKECIHRNNGSYNYNENYYETFGNYADTKWTDGTGWNKIMPDLQRSNINGIISICYCYVIPILAIILIIILVYLYR